MNLNTIILITSALFFFSPSDGQSEKWNFYQAPALSWEGHDMVLFDDGEVLILGSEYNFRPPYNGIPIEGEPCWGSIFLHLDADGNLLKKIVEFNLRLPNFSIHNPSYFFIPTASKQKVFVPISHFVDDGCYKNALVVLDFKNGQMERVVDTIYDYTFPTPCRKTPAVWGTDLWNDSLLVVDNDLYNKPFNFRWYGEKGELLSARAKRYDWISTYTKNSRNLIKKKGDNIIMLGTDHRDPSYEKAVMLELSKTGDSLDATYYGRHIRAREFLLTDKNDFTFISVYNLSSYSYSLLKLDNNMNEVWRKGIKGYIASMVELKNGHYLLAHDTNSVSVINEEGRVLSSKKYGISPYQRASNPFDLIEKIALLNDSTFIAMGTRYVPFWEAEVGKPVYSIFTIKDKISNLDIVGTDDIEVDNNSLLLFPNPASDWLYFHLPAAFGKTEQGAIYNLNGRRIKIFSASEVVDSQGISVAELPQGVYIFRIKNSKGSELVQKFVKF